MPHPTSTTTTTSSSTTRASRTTAATSPIASSSRHVIIDEQPQRTSQMRKSRRSGGNRNAHRLVVDENGERDWSYKYWDCLGTGGASTCLIAWICPCIIYSQNKSRLDYLEAEGTYHPLGGEPFEKDCYYHCLLFALCGCSCILQKRLRNRIRKRYSIRPSPGDDIVDGCASWCCLAPCELTQDSREMFLEERSLTR